MHSKKVVGRNQEGSSQKKNPTGKKEQGRREPSRGYGQGKRLKTKNGTFMSANQLAGLKKAKSMDGDAQQNVRLDGRANSFPTHKKEKTGEYPEVPDSKLPPQERKKERKKIQGKNKKIASEIVKGKESKL